MTKKKSLALLFTQGFCREAHIAEAFGFHYEALKRR